MQASGLTEIIPFIWISAIWDQYPVIFTSWATSGSRQGVAAVWWQWNHRYSFPSWVPLDSGTHTGEWESVKTVKSLFIDIAGNIPVLTASKIYSKTKYFILLNFTHYNQLQDADTCPPSYCLSILTCHTESTVSPIVLSQWLSLLWLRIFHLLLNYIE